MFRIKRDPAKVLGSAVARSTPPFGVSVLKGLGPMLTKVLLALSFLLCVCGSALAQQSGEGASPAWSIGNRHARVVIEVFSDYQCRRCTAFNTDLKRLQVKYGDSVRMIFRQFPLTQIHDKALLAAQAAEAAGLQGKFFQMNDLLYSQAREWEQSKNVEDQFIIYARQLKLNLKRFRSDLSGIRVQARIGLDTQRARALNLPGTPTVVLSDGLVMHEDLANLDTEINKRLNAGKSGGH